MNIGSFDFLWFWKTIYVKDSNRKSDDRQQKGEGEET